MKKTLILLFLIQTLMAKAQSTWYYGQGAGLKFNSGSLYAASGSTINTDEGCAGVVDNLNNVILYTDGNNIWNGNHQLQLNLNTGWNSAQLNGLKSSTHAALICPIPGTNNTKFFIFTATDGVLSMTGTSGGYGPLRVSIANVTGTAPNATITVNAAEKNVVITPAGVLAGEKIAMTHDDGCGYWVTTHGVGTYGGGDEWNAPVTSINTTGEKSFYTFHVTQQNNTISSLINSRVTDLFPNGGHRAWGYSYMDSEGFTVAHTPSHLTTCVGQMKFNQQGTQLACAVGNSYEFQIYDFNKTTGHFNTLTQKEISGFGPAGPKQHCGSGMPYGIEFSPDGNFLYVSTNFISSGYNGVYQYTNLSGSVSNIFYSGVALDLCSNQPSTYGGMQLGPNGKLYIANPVTTGVWYYSTPNVGVTACSGCTYLNTVPVGVGHCKLSLPSVMAVQPDPILTPSISITNTLVCAGTPITAVGSATGNVSVQHYAWALEECDANNNLIQGGYTIPLAWDQQSFGTYTFPNSQNVPCNKYYRVSFIVQHLPCLTWQIVAKVIYVACPPTANAGPDLETCYGGCVTIGPDLADKKTTYSWASDAGILGTAFQITVCPPVTTTYTLTATNGLTGCSAKDVVTVNVLDNNPDFSLSGSLGTGAPPTYTCSATPLVQTALSDPNFHYSWIVEEVDPSTGNVVPNTNVTNPDCWWSYGVGTNQFSGYNGTSNLVCGSPSVGQFITNHKYRITRGTWITNTCPWQQISKTIQLCTSCKSADGQPVFVIENDNSAPDYSYLNERDQKTPAISDNAALVVYPNPSSGELTISLHNALEKSYTLKVFDMFGKMIHQNTVMHNQGSGLETKLDLTDMNLPNGLYLINVNSERNTLSQRIVIQK